jgi:pimeloyl-ACP methyl ester carboxylesterase
VFFAPIVTALLAAFFVTACCRQFRRARRRTPPLANEALTGCLLLSALVTVAVAAFSLIDAATFHDAVPAGHIYKVNGRAMHLNCEGSGSPTLLLDAGLGNDAFVWSRVQPVLARETRVCSYDRAGYGWSEPANTARDGNNLASELHGLLTAANVTGPIILAGHSIAGPYIRSYAILYPKDIVGLVFLDAASGQTKDMNRQQPRIWPRFEEDLERIAFYLEIPGLFGACPGSLPGYRWGLTLPAVEALCREHIQTYIGERDSFELSALEASRVSTFGALPILVISRETSNDDWNREQIHLTQLSTNGRRIVAAGSGHYVQADRPDVFIDQMKLFLTSIRH